MTPPHIRRQARASAREAVLLVVVAVTLIIVLAWAAVAGPR
ncbi:hypothetical protein ACSCBZ_46380 [Streptomyces niveiscabiei]|nr:hypothetical protein [Streptomyces niveiscabiei]